LPFSGFDNQSKYGAAFAYARNVGGTDNWGILQRLDRPDPANNDQFGIAMAIGQDTVVVGANATDARGNESGSVYIYRLKYNNPPELVTPIADQTAPTNTLFAFTLAANTFSDPDVSDTLILSATLADNSPLPSWLVFSGAAGTFSGTPVDPGIYMIRVTATDEDGATTNGLFIITVPGGVARVGQPPMPIVLAIRPDLLPGRMVLSYLRPGGAPSSNYTLEYSLNLISWNSGSSLIVSDTVQALDSFTDQAVITINNPAGGNAVFFRIKQTQ
jgi:hypothetical protein